MIKKLLFLISILLYFIFPLKVTAYTGPTFVTFTNPVRGTEGWLSTTQEPLDIPIKLYQEASNSGLPSTWLLRFDAVNDATISAFFNDLIGPDILVSLGGLLEVTPGLSKKVNIYSGGSVNEKFLSGYTPAQRLLLIDAFMDSFKERFGFFPRTIGAWHLDSFSLDYLKTKYSVQTAMMLDDQYQTDGIRLWGGYLGSPYFPDKNNSLIPAESFKNRINLPIVRYAQRDLFNVLNPQKLSLYSIEPNDYQDLGFSTNYFNNLLSLYTQKNLNKFTYLNIGLENDLYIGDYLPQIRNIYAALKENQEKYNIRFSSLEYFGDWMKSLYPESSPVYFYRTSDPSGNQAGEVVWYQTPYFRLALQTQNGQTKITDLRVYNRQIFEDYYTTPNQISGVSAEIPAEIDSVKFPGTSLDLNLDLENYETFYDEVNDIWKIALVNGEKIITLSPKTITFSNIVLPETNFNNLKETKSENETVWTVAPKTPFSNLFSNPIFPIMIVGIVIYFCFSINMNLGFGTLISLIPLIAVFKDSKLYSFGQGYWGSNSHDAIFHLSLIEKIAQNPLTLSHPQLAGEKLGNYHFLFDYLSGIIVRFTHIPASQIYFFFMPLAIAVLLTFFIVKLLRVWKFKEIEIIISLIFVYLAGSLGFIQSALSGNSIFGGESAFWANQSISIFLNPPYALSILILVITLFLLEKYVEKKSALKFVGIVFFGGLLAQTKVYAFILLSASLLLTGQWLFLIFIGIIGVLITLPFSSSAGFPFEFSPFWFIKSMFASSDRLNFEKAANAWQAYEATGSSIKLLVLNLLGIIIFLVGNIGTRILGVWQITKGKNIFLSQKILIAISLVGILIPLIFTQKYNPWNSIQFMYYSLFVFGLFAGRGAFVFINLFNSRFAKVLAILLMVLCTLLTTIGSFKEHAGFYPTSRVGYTELRALEYLKTQPRGVVLAPYFDGRLGGSIIPPKPLYAYSSTAYISGLSGQPEFLSDTVNLDITGYNYQERAKNIQRFYNTADSNWAKNFLDENAIKYIYETPLNRLNLSPGSLSLTKIFESGEINIYNTN
ncbi:TPA: hypothetical protein DEP81_01690 [Candidatus Woesebacteria bacterium]|nr:hypothetical protein [Candidatus Woesebacteria bacterium]